MDEPLSLGAWIGRRRRALDLTQAELAQRVGCALGTLRKLETDERRPSKQLAALLAEQLQLAPEVRVTFLHVARGGLGVDRLPVPAQVGPLSPLAAPPPCGTVPELPAALTPLLGRERPTTSAVLAVLRNPAYAGAFVYGRRQGVRRTPTARRPVQRALPIAAWRVRVPDKYPAYIDWPQYEKIQAMLDDNRAEYTRERTRGVPRAGAALLQGIAYCGESGHKLTVVYRPQAQHRCVELRRRYGGPLCQTIPAGPVDACVVAAFFAALGPAELDLYDRALRDQHAAAERVARAQAQQLERLRYEAALVERQFRRVDPDNRLVAAELERRWEQALREVRQAEDDLAARAATTPPFVLSAPLRAALLDVGAHLPALWASGALSREHQRALLRCLIDKVVLHRPVHDRIRTRIVWRGGDTTTVDVPVAVGAFARLAAAPELEERILAYLAAGRTDHEIAEELTRAGYRSPRRPVVIASTVRNIRLKHRILIARRQSDPRRPTDHLSIAQVAQRLGVAEHWVYARIYRQQILVARDAISGLYLFPDHPDALALLEHLKAGTVKTVRLYKEHHHE